MGLRSLIYPAPDLEKSKNWWIRILGKEPYFDDGGYVGFDIGGYEIGLNSFSKELKGPITYIGVSNLLIATEEMKSNVALTLVGGHLLREDVRYEKSEKGVYA